MAGLLLNKTALPFLETKWTTISLQKSLTLKMEFDWKTKTEFLLRLKAPTFKTWTVLFLKIKSKYQIPPNMPKVTGLFINRKREYLELYNNVFVIDSTNNGLLKGDYVEADSTGRRYVSGNGYLRNIDQDSTTSDTTHIYAIELLMIENDSTSTIDGIGDVSVWSANFSSLSDSLFYNSKSQNFKLLGSPKTWHKNIQLTGPFITVQLDSNQVKELKSHPGAFAVQEDSLTGRLHQLKGDSLFAYFDAGQVSEIILHPKSEILYHTKNDANKPDGAMESASPKTILYFENGELVRAVMGQNQGYFLPEYDGLMARKLDGFSWNPGLRPSKTTVQPTPRWPPIPKERPFTLPDRYVAFEIINQKN